MCVLSHVDIEREVSLGCLVIDPFDPELLRPNSYDWTLGNVILVADHYETNLWHRFELHDGDVAHFSPREFYLCVTKQRFVLPNYMMATMAGRSSTGRLGLIEDLTAAHVDEGFIGHLTGEFKVLGPWNVSLQVGQNVGQIIFQYLHTPAETGYADWTGSHYVNQPAEPVPSSLYPPFRIVEG